MNNTEDSFAPEQYPGGLIAGAARQQVDCSAGTLPKRRSHIELKLAVNDLDGVIENLISLMAHIGLEQPKCPEGPIAAIATHEEPTLIEILNQLNIEIKEKHKRMCEMIDEISKALD